MAERKGKGPAKGRGQLLTYFLLRAAVLVVLVLELLSGRWNNVFLCLLTLLLFMLPTILERRLQLELPSALEIVILLFIFGAEILGEIGEFYVKLDYWDTLLHTVNGFLMAAIGFAMIDILNRSPRFHISLSPVFVACVAFCFSMTIGVLWEFFEYAMDRIFLMDMQKDTLLQTLSSVTLHPEGANIPVVLREVSATAVEYGGGQCEIPGGYLDTGLIDTMQDLLVNCIGALVFSLLGVVYIRRRGGVAQKFIPKLLTREEAQQAEEARENARRARRSARRKK